MDPKTKAFISAAAHIANKEGLTDEEAVATRANEILVDASKDEPETDAGKEARQHALDIIAANATGVASPYIEPVKFDYEKLREETAGEAVGSIIKKMADHAAFLFIRNRDTEDYDKASEDAYQKLSLETFKALNTHNVGMAEYKYVFESIRSIVSALEGIIMQNVVQNRHEIMSRTFGSKNPGTEKFDANYATYEDLTSTLEKVRKATGGNNADYFNITKTTE